MVYYRGSEGQPNLCSISPYNHEHPPRSASNSPNHSASAPSAMGCTVPPKPLGEDTEIK